MTVSPRRERLLLVAAVGALTLVGALYSFSGVNTRDEAWFLQVVSRVSGGDVLYRDVFFGSTPLSVWLALPLVALFGAQVAWIKLVVVGALAATLGLVVWIARGLGAGAAVSLLLAAAVLAFSPAQRGSLYQPLATLFLLACLAAALAWMRASPRAWAWALAGGAAAGLGFASKQNVGLYALAALLAAIPLAGARDRLRDAGLALAGFVVAAAIPLVPVAATGGSGALVDYGFTNKGAYSDLGAVGYLEGFRMESVDVRELLAGGEVIDAVPPAYRAALYLIVPATLVLLVVAFVGARGVERRRVEVVGLFAVAATAAIFPRADGTHLSYVAPVLLLAAWYALDLLLRGRSQGRLTAVALALALAVVPGVAALAAWPVLQAVDRDAHLSTLPHMRGVLFDPARERRIGRTADSLAEAGTGGALFLATPEAGFYYLVSGVENPTPYDFPLATAFGRTGQAELTERIRAGGIDAVCLGYRRLGDLTPWLLVHAVKTSLEPAERTAACRLYRAQ